jgi:alpha-glucosidase (family GH31 glycosyl hydrolase)
LKQTLKYVENLISYLKINSGIEFEEIVCDFVKDEAGTWWLINVKSFILKLNIDHTMTDIYAEEKSKKYKEKSLKKTKKYGHQKLRLCKYC